MQRQPSPSPSHTGLAIGALAAIPVVSVSAAAFLGDVASHTDSSRIWHGLVAMVVGVASGLFVVRVVRALGDGLIALSAALVRWFATADSVVVPRATGRPELAPALVPAVVAVPAAVGRRGPPVVLR